jgi:hypothetical protein
VGEGEDVVERGRDPLTQLGDDREGKVVELGFAHHVAIYGDGDGAHSEILHAGEGVQHSGLHLVPVEALDVAHPKPDCALLHRATVTAAVLHAAGAQRPGCPDLNELPLSSDGAKSPWHRASKLGERARNDPDRIPA